MNIKNREQLESYIEEYIYNGHKGNALKHNWFENQFIIWNELMEQWIWLQFAMKPDEENIFATFDYENLRHILKAMPESELINFYETEVDLDLYDDSIEYGFEGQYLSDGVYIERGLL